MSEILTLDEWRPFSYKIGATGRTVSMELRRMPVLEAAPFKRMLAAARRKFAETISDGRGLEEPGEGATQEQRIEYIRAVDRLIMSSREARAAFYEALPDDELRKVFETAVRGLTVRLGGRELSDAAALMAVADEDMLMFVINHLEFMSSLSDSEGKDSASPSTSGSERETAGSPSAATSTASEASPAPSTAPATSTARESSTSPSA